ncbi:hypothetical protein BE11_42700 [Sorangium cellulosum]|nr:hypothetical protein BE11_42700 [Sorangium cellulosum]
MVEQGEHDITIHLSIDGAQRAHRARCAAAAPTSSACTVRSRPLTSALALAAHRRGEGEAGGLELSAAAALLLLARALPA